MRRVKLLRPLLAALMLVAWCVTGAHMVLEHGGNWHGAAAHEEPADDHSDSDHAHHHDLATVLLGKGLAVPKLNALAMPEQPLAAACCATVAGLEVPEPLAARGIIGDSPPDARASGWLHVTHTARPVRGPSLAA